MKPRPTPRAVLLLALGLVACAAHAAPLQITDITLAGSFTAGTPETITGNATLTSVTTSEGLFSTLVGAVANNAASGPGNAPYSIGTVPADNNAAVSGLTVNDAINNFSTGNFQFGLGSGGFTAATRFFIIENTPVSSTSGDPTTVQLINASNTVVGSFSLSLLAAHFTTTAANTTNTALATATYTAGTGNLVGKLGGVAFSLADLGVSDYSAISTATGIRLTSASLLDPSVVGAYSPIPEPSSIAALAGLAGLASVALRRTRRV